RLARLIRSIQAPPARACIVWLIATHVEKVPNIAPDLLRILAKNFVNEDEIVKVSSDPALRREANSPEEFKYNDEEEVEEEDEEYDEDEEEEDEEGEEEEDEEEEGSGEAEDEETAEDGSSEEGSGEVTLSFVMGLGEKYSFV
ncbi:unnamed protein product, partial [Strongylus vulgaris]